MAQNWVGSISLEDGSILSDICILPRARQSSSTKHSSAHILPSDATLTFLSIVETAQIPLRLANGPAQDVLTYSADTSDWFAERLSHGGACDADDGPFEQDVTADGALAARVSSTAVLTRVAYSGANEVGIPRTTEILFYATAQPAEQGGILTPPPSSPTLPEDDKEFSPIRCPSVLIVKALPLSSDLLYRPPTPPPESDQFRPVNAVPDCQFVPLFHAPTSDEHGAAGKGKGATDAFAEAAAEGEKRQRRGGASVAAAASRIESRPPHLKLDIGNIGRKSALPSPALPSPGVGNLRSPVPPEARPQSRKGPLDGPLKRSSLSRVTSFSNDTREATTGDRNKETISRLIMAGMRIYGFQQRKKGKVEPSGADEQQQQQEERRDEEYKLIYHQTYRSVMVAFRKHIETAPLHAHLEKIRETVDKLLAIFCTDPLLATPAEEMGFMRSSQPEVETRGKLLPAGTRNCEDTCMLDGT